MTTVINTPGNVAESDSLVGIIMGLIVLLVVTGLFFVYALPAIRASGVTPTKGSIDVNVKLPAEGSSPSTAPASPTY